MPAAPNHFQFGLRRLLVLITVAVVATAVVSWWFREPPPRWRTIDEILDAHNVNAESVVGSLPDRSQRYATFFHPQRCIEGTIYDQPRNPIDFPNLPPKIHVPLGHELKILHLRTADNESVGIAWLVKLPSGGGK